MPRKLSEIDWETREAIIGSIEAEAQAAAWHTLSNPQKSDLYDDWSRRFDLHRPAIKDQVMKGFDAAQHIPPSGEAAVHERLKELLQRTGLPHVDDKVKAWSGRGAADFVLGFSPGWLVVIAELESARNWQSGLMQALWYRSSYFQETALQALPCLILFGDVTEERWTEISTTCLGQSVLFLGFELLVDGRGARNSIRRLLVQEQGGRLQLDL